MKRVVLSIMFVLNLGVQNISFVMAAEDAPDQLVLEQERRLKTDAEGEAQSICDSVLGKGSSNVLVSVELGLQSVRKGGANLNQKRDNKSSVGDDNFILPWVPAPKSVTKEETPKDANVETQAAQQSTLDVKTVLTRFDITVIHDKDIPADRIGMAKEMITGAFDRYKNVLKVYFKPTAYVRPGAVNPKDEVKKNLWDFFKPQYILLFLALLLFMTLLKFFFGPLADFMKKYLEGMKEQAKSKVEMENKSETENETDENAENEESLEEGQLTPEELQALEEQAQAEEEAMKKFVPFTYINDENVKQLAYLLHDEEPWVVALVISYLSPEHAFKVMEVLPSDLQAKVALETAMYRQTSLDQVVAINEDIKEKIDFVVGGLEKLVGILESSDRFARENILEYLKNEKPSLYERVREHILLFDDIANFPKVAMQVVVRELKTEELGKALRGASPELQQKFFDNMSQGAVTLLKEEIQYGRPSTNDQVEEERRKIVDYIKNLEKEGKVSFRQKGKMAAMNGDEMGGGTPTLRGGTNPEAQAAYNAGVEAQNAGQLEEAVAQLEQSVQLDPAFAPAQQALGGVYYSLGRTQEALATYDQYLQLEPNEEFRVWVEELRASVPSATV